MLGPFTWDFASGASVLLGRHEARILNTAPGRGSHALGMCVARNMLSQAIIYTSVPKLLRSIKYKADIYVCARAVLPDVMGRYAREMLQEQGSAWQVHFRGRDTSRMGTRLSTYPHPLYSNQRKEMTPPGPNERRVRRDADKEQVGRGSIIPMSTIS